MSTIIETCERIVANKQYEEVGGEPLDMQTANAILSVHGALNAENKIKFANLPLSLMAKFAWKHTS